MARASLLTHPNFVACKDSNVPLTAEQLQQLFGGEGAAFAKHLARLTQSQIHCTPQDQGRDQCTPKSA